MRFFSNTTLENEVCRPKSGINLYPFGSPMPGRQFNSSSYRYGFNGKENDNEVKGTGNSVDFGGRIYDSRLGRWLSLDPLVSKYPSVSPYNFALNGPISTIDVDGEDIFIAIINSKTGKTETVKANVEYVFQVLNSTKAGHDMLAKYADNPKVDIYITVGTTPVGDAGVHNQGDVSTDDNGKKQIIPPMCQNDNGVIIYDPSAFGAKNFEGVEIQSPGKENHFITLSEDGLSSGVLGLSQSTAKAGAKALAHEIGAHVSGEPFTTTTAQHDAWGQKELVTTTLKVGTAEFKYTGNGTGKAKEVNDQIDAVRVTKKESVSTSNVSTKGSAKLFKVELKK